MLPTRGPYRGAVALVGPIGENFGAASLRGATRRICVVPSLPTVGLPTHDDPPHAVRRTATDVPGAHTAIRASGFSVAAVLAAGLAAAMLLAPALWNGFALLQYDTGGYLARWYEGFLVPSRPGAYGLLLAAAGPLNFWPTLLVQAGLTVWVLSLVLRAHGLGRRPDLLLGIAALLTVTTTLPWLTSILLTDIFTGLAVLGLHLVVMRRSALARWEVIALTVLIGFAAATHAATLLVLFALTAVAALTSLLSRPHVTPSGLARALATVILGVALTLTANFAVSGRFAWTPGGASLLFGRMLQDGIVDRYLEDHCPNPRLRLCLYRKELPEPRSADRWFWGSDLFDQMGRFAGLGEEMETIALGALRKYPLLQAKAAAIAFRRQLVSVATGEGVVNWIWHSYAIVEKYTPWAVPAMRAARQQQPGIYFWDKVNRVHVPIALGAMALLPFIIWLGYERRRFAGIAPSRDIATLAATATLAILANAAVCGILSNPHDRYGARVAWLAVLVVGVAAATRFCVREESGGDYTTKSKRPT